MAPANSSSAEVECFTVDQRMEKKGIPKAEVLNMSPANSSSAEVECFTVDQRMEKKGIPKAEVLEDIAQYLKTKNLNVEDATDQIKEDYRKYKLVEDSFVIQKTKITESIADYKKSLTALEMLAEQEKKDCKQTEVTYKLDENIYSKAIIENYDKVCIWLGANIMVEYGREEAQEMLKTNLENIEKADHELDENLDFLRDQITTTEVNVAHLYNYGICLNVKK